MRLKTVPGELFPRRKSGSEELIFVAPNNGGVCGVSCCKLRPSVGRFFRKWFVMTRIIGGAPVGRKPNAPANSAVSPSAARPIMSPTASNRAASLGLGPFSGCLSIVSACSVALREARVLLRWIRGKFALTPSPVDGYSFSSCE